MDDRAFLSSLQVEERARLTESRDGPAGARLAATVVVSGVLVTWIANGWTFWPLAMVPLGLILAFLFTLQHECTHLTPFRSHWLNIAVGHLTGLILFQPFLWFRAFHLAHHRHTNDPEHDPELEDAKPEGWRQIAWHVATPRYWLMKGRVLVDNAFGPMSASYVTERIRPRLRLEARLMLAVYATALMFTLTVKPILLWVWLLPLALGFPFLRLYLLAEHGRCPHVANMFDNTRTTLTNGLVRALAWNMPYHAEHHAWPSVPYFRLPEVHRLAHPHLKRVSRGYVGFFREYLTGR